MKLKQKIIFLVMLIIFLLYGGIFIYKSSVKINNKRWFVLFDDAMVSMKYAKNLAEGHGLVWNINEEKVEGYTNFLWTLYMSIPHFMKIDISKTSLFIQISGLIFLFFTLIYTFKIAEILSEKNFLIMIISVFFTAFYFPLVYWSLMGMEVSALSFLIVYIVHYIIKNGLTKKFNPKIYILTSGLVLIRPDMLVFILVIIFYLSFIEKDRAKEHLIWGIGSLIFFFGSITIFRILYYGDILPNTYYLKLTGYPLFLRITRGLFVIIEALWYMNWLLVLIALVPVFKLKDWKINLLFIIIMFQILYSIYVGGDAWEWWGGANRYWVIVMPLFFVLLSMGMYNLSQLIIESFDIFKIKKEKYVYLLFFILVIIGIININTLKGLKSLKQCIFKVPALHVEDDKEVLKLALYIKDITTPDARLGVTWAGIIPYFSERNAEDFLGKNCKFIARLPMKMPHPKLALTDKLIFFYPGHLKWDNDYSIRSKNLDIIVSLWWEKSKIKDFLEKYYIKDKTGIFLRKNSKNILWEKVEM